jgi:hypothetical protein
MSAKFLGFVHEGKLPYGRTVLRGTLGSVRIAVAHHIRPGPWLFYAEATKAKGNGYKVEMLDGGCTLLIPRWPKKKKRKTAAPKSPKGDAA